MAEIIKTLVILNTQFSNIFEGAKPASLTYEADYDGDDTTYMKSYQNNLIDEVCTQADFWDCVSGYKESFSITVHVVGDHTEKEKLEAHLTKLIREDMTAKVGRTPESSFLDDMDEEKKKEIDEGVALAKRDYPKLFKKY
jgi:hypothetical protein